MNFIWIAYFLILILLAVLPSKRFLGSRMHLFRAFLPSWKFFDDSDRVPLLQVKFHSDPQSLEKTPWENLMPSLSRRPWGGLFYNPEMNYRLSVHSLLQQICQEAFEFSPDENPNFFEEKPSYQILQNIVQYELQKRSVMLSAKSIDFQFRILVCQSDQNWTPVDDLLISKSYKLKLQNQMESE